MMIDDIPTKAFQTMHGHYHFFVMSFGLTNVVVTFMDLINHVLIQYIDILIIVFIDNIFIFLRCEDDHTDHLRSV